MKKWQKLLTFALAFALVCTVALGVTGIIAFGSSVIEIDSADELRKIGVDAAYPLDGDYKLTADIDLSDKEWTPIGYDGDAFFTGTFDGDGHIISGLHIGTKETVKTITIDKDSHYGYGLFGYLGENAKVSDLAFENICINISATNRTNVSAGAVAGYSNKSGWTIENVSVLSGMISGVCQRQTRIGGIMGVMTNATTSATIKNCYNGADITSGFSKTASNIGSNSAYAAAAGIVGFMDGKNVALSNCVNTGAITTTQSALNSNRGSIGNIAAYPSTTATAKTALNTGSTITGCYALADQLTYDTESTVTAHFPADANTDNVTVLSAADAATASKYTALTSGWTLRDGYYPIPSAFADYAVPADLSDGYTYITIGSAEELRKIGTNDSYPMSNVYYKLVADIDLSDKVWIPIGLDSLEDTEANLFTGTFDGNGHVISGMWTGTETAYQELACANWGLISRLTDSGVVKNLAFKDIYFNVGVANKNTNSNIAAVAGVIIGNSTLIENVAVLSGTIQDVNSLHQVRVAGIVGCFTEGSTPQQKQGGCTIRNCFNAADLIAKHGDYSGGSYACVGGILASPKSSNASANTTIENCLNVGRLTSIGYSGETNNNVGNIVSYAGSATDVTIKLTCRNNYAVSGVMSLTNASALSFDAEKNTVVDVCSAGDATKFSGLTSATSSAWTVKTATTVDGETTYYYPMLKTFEDYSMSIDIIYIDSAEELRKIGVDGAYPMDATYVLTADIDVFDKEWVPLGNDGNQEFTGIFNGGGHVISGLHIGTVNQPKTIAKNDDVNKNAYNFGMFEWLGAGATVSDLAFKDICLNIDLDYQWLNVGALSGYAKAGVTVDNVAVLSGLVSGVGGRQVSVGGVIARASSTSISITNCFNGADVVSSHKSASGGQYAAAAGIVGDVYKYPIVIRDCLNVGKVSSLAAGNGSSDANTSSVGQIAAAPRLGNNTLPEGSVFTDNYGIGGLLSYVKGTYSGHCTTDSESVTVVDLFFAADETKFAGLTSGTDSVWTVKADNGDTSYYPMLKSFVTHSVAIDELSLKEAIEDAIESINATNYLTEADVKNVLAFLAPDATVELTLNGKATAEADGSWKVKVTLTDSTVIEKTLVIERLPAINYAFELSTPGMAQGTVTVTLPSDYAGDEYALAWGTADGPLDGYSYLTLADEFTINGKVLTYQIPDRVVIPVGATRLWVLVNDILIAEYEIPQSRLTNLGNLKYTYGLLSDIHISTTVNGSSSKAFAAALDLFESANASFTVVTGDITNAARVAEWTEFNRVISASGYDSPVWVSAGNHDALEWNIDTAGGLIPETAINNMIAAVGDSTYANENYTGPNGEYKVTVSEKNPQYDYTVQYGDDLFIYMGIGVYNSNFYKDGAKTNTSQHLDPSQLEWLEEVLDEYYNTSDVYGNVYLMFHYYTVESGFALVYDKPSGTKTEIDSGKGYIAFNEWSGPRDGQMPDWNSSDLLWNLLKKYPNVIHFSGHSHRYFNDNENLSVTRYWKTEGLESDADLTWKMAYSATDEDLGYTAVHIPSGQYSEGYIVSVYDTGVLITGYNTGSGEVVSYANFFLPKALDTELHLRVNDGYVQYVQGYGEWKNLVKVEDLAGNGEIEVQVSDTHVQWREKGKTEWNDLISLDDLNDLNGKMMQVKFGFNNAPTALKYGDEIILSAVGGQSNAAVTYSVVSGPATVDANTGLLKITGVGEVKVKAVLAGNDDYVSIEQTVTVIAGKRAVTVTADNKTKTYGAADPELTYKVEGLIGNDTLTGSLKYTGTNVGTYDIVEDAAFTAGENYDVTFVKGTMTVTAAPSTDNTQGSTSSGSTGSAGTTDTGANTDSTGSAGNTGNAGTGDNPATSDRNTVLFAVIAGFVTVLSAVILFFVKRKKAA